MSGIFRMGEKVKIARHGIFPHSHRLGDIGEITACKGYSDEYKEYIYEVKVTRQNFSRYLPVSADSLERM